jgi:hypothetical protein
VRNSLVAALVACADRPLKSKARRFLAGLSCDELQFIAGFLGSCILESQSNCPCDGAGRARKPSPDQELKMILLLEYLCRSGIQKLPMTARAGSPTVNGSAGRRAGLLDDAAFGMRFQLDLPECGFVLGYVLLQDIQQCLGLLWAEVNALKIVDCHVVSGSLVDPPEHQKEVPQIHAYLNAVGVVLPVLRAINQLNLGRGLLRHTLQRITRIRRRMDKHPLEIFTKYLTTCCHSPASDDLKEERK